MKIKTNLHFHTSDDTNDPIVYTTYQGIDKAAELGFGALAITCHQTCAWTKDYADYAEKKGILLIPGIEIFIGKNRHRSFRHTVLLNVTPEAQNIRTFKELETYKKAHPEIFVLAPHPYFYGNFSLHKFLTRHIHLYDGIEQSWFYSKWFNRNIKGEKVARTHHLPFIATSDTHFFDFMDKSYCTVDADEKTPEALFAALKSGRFENTTSPRRFWTEMVWKQGLFFVREIRWRRHHYRPL